MEEEWKEITKEALDTANSGDDKYYNFHKGIKNSEDFKTISIEFTYINGAKEKWPHNMYLTENGWVTKDEFWGVSNNGNCGNCGYNVPERAFIENILSKMPI